MRNSSIFIAIAALSSAVLFGACSGISTSTDFDPATDFSKYSTWAWADNEGDEESSGQIVHGRIQRSVESELESKGLRRTDSDPDLAVGYQIASDQRRSYDTVHSGWGGGYGWSGWGGYGMGTSTTYERVWEEGSLVLGIFDVETKNLVWTGSASATLNPGDSPEKKQKLVDDAVTKMMKDFPPGP